MPIPFHPVPEAFLAAAAQLPGTVLLATQRCDEENFRSYLFADPVEILMAQSAEAVPEVFARIAAAQRAGCFVAGYLAYECGEYFTGVPLPVDASAPLAWLGVYRQPCIFDHRTGTLTGALPEIQPVAEPTESAQIEEARLLTGEPAYTRQIEAIHEWIRRGDTYQVNLTGPMRFRLTGSPMALFRRISQGQPVAYSAYLNLGERQILSLSPELFFRVEGETIVTRPMKGTAPRGRTAAEDEQTAAWLAADEKNRAENLMIVDLLRNDLGRICRFGTVRARQLFAVEQYETLFQMVSTVCGQLRPGVGPYELFAGLFPSGSITGAPKIRTMQIIRDLELAPRGVYTGAIGCFAPTGDAVFSVAIRTAVVQAGQGTMGLGSGITIDSAADDEYRECLLKARFLTDSVESFALIESLLWDGSGYPLLGLHLERLAASAAAFGYCFEASEVRARLDELGKGLTGRQKVRLLLHRDGRIETEAAPLAESVGPVRAVLCPEPVDSVDRFLRHKTTRRERYNHWFARAQALGYDEVLFVNERGELAEGAISNLFLELDGELLTPPVASGLLPGVYRRHLLAADARAREQVLVPRDLCRATAVYLTNAVRGLRRVEVVQEDARLGRDASGNPSCLESEES